MMTKHITKKTPIAPKKTVKSNSLPENRQNRLITFLRSEVGKIVGLIIVAISSAAVTSTFQTSIIPGEYLYLSVLLGITVVAFVVYQLMQKKERSVFKKGLLAISAAVILLSSGYIIAFNRTTDAFISNIQSTSKQGTGTVITKPYVVYISGIDTYGDVSAVSRSDVNMLAVVNPQTKKILLVNTPRDYYVQLHGTTGVKDKLTHAGIYGIDMSKNTMQDLYETKIDYTVRINFTSLLKIVDALGGIEVQSDQAFNAGGFSFQVGSNTLNSKQALAFSRERHSFATGDRQRGKDQQKVIEAIIAKATHPDIILSYQTILSSVGDSLQTNASKQEISDLIRQQLSSAGQWQSTSISVDGTGATSSTYSMGNQLLYVMIPDLATVAAAKAAIQTYRTTTD